MSRLERDALRICARFALRYRVLEAERANVKSRYGVCFSDGTIRIRLRHATTGKPLKYSSLVNTLCHELAHLKHFNHGPRFQTYYAQILEWSRREGIYQPGKPRGATQPGSGPPPELHGQTVSSAHVSVSAARGAQAPNHPPARKRRNKPSGPSAPTPSAQLELFG